MILARPVPADRPGPDRVPQQRMPVDTVQHLPDQTRPSSRADRQQCRDLQAQVLRDPGRAVRTVEDQSFGCLAERVLIDRAIGQAQLVDRLQLLDLIRDHRPLRMIQLGEQLTRVRGHDHRRRVRDHEVPR